MSDSFNLMIDAKYVEWYLKNDKIHTADSVHIYISTNCKRRVLTSNIQSQNNEAGFHKYLLSKHVALKSVAFLI